MLTGKTVAQFSKYLIVGALCFIFEVYLFYLLKASFSLVTSNLLARSIALVLHFLLIKNYVFFIVSHRIKSMLFYFLLSIVNAFFSGILIYLSSLYLLSLNPAIYKIIFDVSLIVLNFVIFKRYIFK